MSKLKKFQVGGLNQNNLQPGATPTNSAIDLTGATDRFQILANQLNSFNTSEGSALTQRIPGSQISEMSRDPFIVPQITDPNLIHPEDNPHAYMTNFKGDWVSMVNDHRNRVKEFRIMSLQDRTAHYQNMVDLMDKYSRDIDTAVAKGDPNLSAEKGEELKNALKSGQFNTILDQGYKDTFNDYINQMMFGNKNISEWLNEEVMGKFIENSAKQNAKDVEEGYKDEGSGIAENWIKNIFSKPPETYEEFKNEILNLGERVSMKQAQINQEIPDWTGMKAPVNPLWKINSERSRLDEETFMSSIPIVGKISGMIGTGKKTDWGGDNYMRYQSGEDLAGTMATFEGHLMAGLGAGAVHLIGRRLGLPKSVMGRLIQKTGMLGAVGAGLAYSREMEGSMEVGEAYWRSVDNEIARQESKKGRPLTAEEKANIRMGNMNGIRDMRVKNRMLVGNDMAQFALTWLALRGGTRTLLGRKFVNSGMYQRLASTYPGRLGMNFARYGTFVNMNRQMEGWEEGQQWKWTNDYLSGYSSNHGVFDLAGDFYNDGKEVAKAMAPNSMHELIGANPDIYTNHAFQEAVQSGRDMGTMMVAGPRLGRGIMDMYRFREAVNSLGKDGEAYDKDQETKMKSQHIFNHLENGTSKHLISALFRAGRSGLMTPEEAEKAIQKVSDYAEIYDHISGKRRFSKGVLPKDLQEQLGTKGTKGFFKSLAGVKPLNKLEREWLFGHAVGITDKKDDLIELNKEREEWLDAQSDNTTSWLESDFMSQEEKDNVRNTLEEKGLGKTPFDAKIKEVEEEIKEIQKESIDMIGDRVMLVPSAAGIQTVNRKRYEAYRKTEVSENEKGDLESKLVGGLMFEIAALEKQKKEGKLTPEAQAELKRMKAVAAKEQYEMLTEPGTVKQLKRFHKIAKSLALYNASQISQLLVQDPKGNLGKILEEMLDRNIKIDQTTLEEVEKMQRFFHHHANKIQKALNEAKGVRFSLGEDKLTSEMVERRKALRGFVEEGSATESQKKELAKLDALAEESKQIQDAQTLVDTLNEENNDIIRTQKAVEKYRRRKNKTGFDDFLMDDNEFGELTDEDFREKAANEIIYDGLQYIKNNIEINENFADQGTVEYAIRNLKEMKQILEQRDRDEHPWITDELIAAIDVNLEKLQEYLTTVTDRVNDRTREQYLYEDDVFIGILSALGIEFETLETTTELGKAIEEAIGTENLIKWKDDVDSKKLPDKHAAVLLLLQMFDEARSDEKSELSTLGKEIKALKKGIIDHAAVKRILKITGRTQKGIKANKEDYTIAPRNQFSFFLTLLMDTNDQGTGIDDKGAYLDYTVHKNLYKFLRDVQEAGARPEDKTLTQDELINLIETQIRLEGLMAITEYLQSDFRIDVQIRNEWSLREQGVQGNYPSKQQTIAVRNLVQFLKGPAAVDEDHLYSTWIYLKSPAGTGKTQVILPWMLKTSDLNVSTDVLAVGHNEHSSETVASAIGKDKPMTIPELLALIEGNGVSSDIRLLIIDEVAGLDDQTLQALAEAIQSINLQRKEEGLEMLKVVATGDPNQITANYTAEFAPIDEVTVEIVTPVSTVYRTDVSAITNFQDLFRGNVTDVASTEIDVKMNATNPYGVRKTDDIVGVWGTNTNGYTLQENILRRLKETTAEDGKTRAIITLPELIDEYKKRLESHSIEGVEVLQVTEAQGRTITEVYIDLPNNPKYFHNNRAYNKAIYTAASRAERFIMVGNLNIRNQADLNLVHASGRTHEQLVERGREFQKEVQSNLTWVKNHGKELDYSEPGGLTLEEEQLKNESEEKSEEVESGGETQEAKTQAETDAKEQSEEKGAITEEPVEQASEEDAEDIDTFASTIEDEQDWADHTQKEEEVEWEGEGPLITSNEAYIEGDQFHILRFPEYASVRGYYSKAADGSTVWNGQSVEGKEIANVLAHNENGKGARIFIVKAKVQKKGADGKMKTVEGLVLISRAKDLDGNVVSYKQSRGLYQRIAVLGEGEIDKIPFLRPTEKAELKRVLADKKAPIVKFDSISRGILATPEGTTASQLEEIALIDNIYVRQKQRLNYEYAGYEDQDRGLYSRVKAQNWGKENKDVVENMLSQFISDFYSDFQKPANSSHIMKAKVRVYTHSDIKKGIDDIHLAQYKVKAGIPYLVIEGTQSEGTKTGQRQFIQMRPRKMSSKIEEDYKMYLEPIEEFITIVEQLQEATGLMLGTHEFREFMKSEFYPDKGNSRKDSKYKGKPWSTVKQQIWGSLPNKIDPTSAEGKRTADLRTAANRLIEEQIEYKGDIRKQTGKAQYAINLLAKANSNIAIQSVIEGTPIRTGKSLLSMSGDFQWSTQLLREWFVHEDSQGYLKSGLRIPINLKTFRYGESTKAFNGEDELSTNRKEAALNLENILVRVHPTSIVIDRGPTVKESGAEKNSKYKKEKDQTDPNKRKDIKGGERTRDYTDEVDLGDLKGKKISEIKARKLLAELLPDLFDESGRARFISFNDGKDVTTGFEILSALDMIRKTGDSKTLGTFMSNIIYLLNKGGVFENVIRHEVGHKVVAHYLTEKERAQLFKSAREHFTQLPLLNSKKKELRRLQGELKFWAEYVENFEEGETEVVQPEGYTIEGKAEAIVAEMRVLEDEIKKLEDKKVYLNEDIYNDEMIEEMLFREFMVLEKDMSISAKLRRLIKKILKFFGIVNKNANDIDKFFANINDGYFSGFEGDVISPTRNFQEIEEDFGSIAVYRVAKKRFLTVYHDLLYNDNKAEQKVKGDTFENAPRTNEEALKESVEFFKESFEGFLKEGETIEGLKEWELNLYKAFEVLSKTSILRSLHNELYRKKVKSLYDETSERFEDEEVEVSNVNLRDHILSAKSKDSINSLVDHTIDFLYSVNYKIGDTTHLIDVRNGYFRLLEVFHGMNMDMTQEQIINFITERQKKLGGTTNLAGEALKDALVTLVNRAHLTDYNFKPLPTHVQFYNQDLFLLSKNTDLNIAKEYNPKVQVNKDVIAIKRRKEGGITESTGAFWGRIMKALEDNKVEIEPGALNALYTKEIATETLRNIYNNTSNKREEKMKVGQYKRVEDGPSTFYKFKWFLRKTFGNRKTIEQKLENFIIASADHLKKKAVSKRLLKSIQRDANQGIEDFFNEINFAFDNHVIITDKGSEAAISLQYFLTDLVTIGSTIKVIEEVEDSKGETKQKKVSRKKTIQDVIDDHSTFFEILSTSLNATDSRAKSQSIRNVEGNVIHKFHDSSFGDDVIITVADNKKPLHTHDGGKTKAAYNHFWQYNSFVNGKNTIHSIQDLDGIEDLNGYRGPTLYQRESTPEWLQRNFVYMFLNGLRSAGATSISYDQQLHTISDKPSPVGAQVRVLNDKQVNEGIKQMVMQHDDKQNLERYVHSPSEQRVRNKDGFLVGKYNSKHAIMFGDILNNGQSVAARAKLIKQEILNHAQEVQDFIESKETGIFVMPNNLASIRNRLVDKGILNKLPQSLKEEAKEGRILSDLLKTFVTNYAINSFFTNQLVVGDQGMFKDEYDIIKRMSIAFAPGTAGTINQNFGMKKTFKVSVMEDPQGSAFDFLTQREYNKLQDDLRNIHGIVFDLADGQGFMTPERAADIMRGFPGLNLGKVMKGVYARVGDDAVLRTLKYSSVVLSDELTKKHPKLKKVLNEMRRQEVDELVFASAMKNGQPLTLAKQGYKTIINAAGKEVVTQTANKNFNPEIHDDSIIELYNDGFRIQLDPIADINSLVANMSQLTYLLNTNGNNRAAAAEYYKITSEIIDMGLMDLMNEIGLVNSSGQMKEYKEIKNKENVRRRIRYKVLAAVKNLESGQKEAEMLGAKVRKQKGNTFVTDNAVDLNFPGLVNKVISTLASQFGKSTVAFRFPGAKLVLQSSYGVTIYETRDQGIKTYDDIKAQAEKEDMSVSAYKKKIGAKERELRHMTGKTPYVEVILPAIYKDRINLGDDVYQRTGKGNILGFRIPSTELHSAVALRVVGFYDSSETNVIIAPKEIVPLHGSDFDVDTLFIIRRAIMEDKDKNNRYLYATDKRGLVDPTDDTNILIPMGKDMSFKRADHYHDVFTEELVKATDKDVKKAIRKTLNKLTAIKMAAKKNRLLEIYLDVIQDEKNRYSMLTPISMELINGQEGSVFAELAKRLGVRIDELLPRKNLMLPLDESHMHQSNKDGAQLVGRFANLMKAVAYMFNSGEQILTKDYKGRTRWTNLTPKLTDSKGNDITFKVDDVEYGSFHRFEISKNDNGKIVKSDYTIWQVFDMYINAAIDNAKEQILHILNVTNTTGAELAVMIAFGIPLQTSSKILLQPAIKYIGQSTKSQHQAIMNAYAAVKALLLEKGMTEAQYEALSGKELDITTAKLNKTFDKKKHKIKDLKDLNRAELIHQHQVLRLFHSLTLPAKSLGVISNELNILRKMPSTFHEITTSKEAWEQITGDVETDKKYISDRGKGVQFHIPEFLNRNPHIRSAIKSLKVLHTLIGAIIPKHAPQIVDFTNDMMHGYETEYGETEHEVSDYIRGEFTKYLASAYYNTDGQAIREYMSFGTRKVVIGGIDAFNEELIETINKHPDKDTNSFLNNLIIVKRRSGLRYMKYSNAAGLTVEELHGIYEQFDKLDPKLREDIVKYATLNEGLSFGAANITMVIHPKHVSEVDAELSKLMRRFAYTEKGVEQLNNLYVDFLIQFGLNNHKKLPRHYSIDSSSRTSEVTTALVKKGESYAGVDYAAGEQIIYDLKIDKDLRKNPPILMSNHTYGDVYIRVFTDDLEEGGFAYYQNVGRGHEKFSTTKYTADKTVGTIMYDKDIYFRKDVLTRAKEDMYDEESMAKKEIIYSPRNNKKLRGVEVGGKMILRPYDDHTRRRAMIYDVVSEHDNWGKEAAKQINSYEKKINEAKTDKTRDKYTKLLDALEEKLSKKGAYRFDYVLNNPISLHNISKHENIQASTNVNKRGKKIC